MIKFEHTETWGWTHAIRGLRNPMNSWDRIDSDGENLGVNDKKLMTRLIEGGEPHRKFLRQIMVSVDITAPLYWFKQFDTYRVGITENSTSTMHKLMAKPFEKSDFSFEKLDGVIEDYWISERLDEFNKMREAYVNYDELIAKGELHDITRKDIWDALIQMLPESYNQKRTVTMNYENLLNILKYRRGHRLDEWQKFCDWIGTLPNSDILFEGLK